MKRREVIGLGVVGLGLSGCLGETVWHRRLTVTVNTPQGPVSGFSVQRETLAEGGGWWAPPEARGASRALSGEAVVVEVAPGRYLFALLEVGRRPDTFAVIFPGEAPLETVEKLTALRQSFVLDRSQYPMLVTFTDITDPKTVKEVNPADLAASFGPGYALQSITLEITEDKVTNMISTLNIPWLQYENPIFIDWKKYPADHPLRGVRKHAFQTRR